MPILAVNGGGNTPNGEAAGDRSDATYVLTGIEDTTREDSDNADTFSFDQSTTYAEGRFETRSSDLAFWGDIHSTKTEATLTWEEGSTDPNRLYVGNLSYQTTTEEIGAGATHYEWRWLTDFG